MSATPVAQFLIGGSVAASGAIDPVFIGGTTDLTVQFANTGSAVGYAPYIDIDLDALAANGLSLTGASYLGVALQMTTLTFDASGNATNPYAKDASGNPVIMHGTPGDTVAVIQLPFGSFAPTQTPADIQLTLVAASTANVSTVIPVVATAGFAYGETPLGTPQGDWPVIQSAPSTVDLETTLVTVSSTYNGPEQEAAAGTLFGTIYNESWTVSANVALDAVLANFVLTDPLPAGAVANAFTISPDGGHTNWIYDVNSLTGSLTLDALSAPGAPAISATGTGAGPWVWFDAAANEVVANFGTITGAATSMSGASTGPEITSSFTLSQYQQLGSSVGASNGGDLTLTDMLPYGAVATGFTLTGPQGSFIYSVSGGTITLLSGPAGATAPAILSGPGTTGTEWVYWDAADGKIVSDFGMLSAGQTGAIHATYIGGQYQGKTGYAWENIGANQTDTNVQLVDQLPGGTSVSQFTIQSDQGSFVYSVDGSGNVTLMSGNALYAPAIGVGPGAAGTSWVYYDAANSRIVANLASVSGGASGVTASISAVFSGGTLLNASNPQDVPLSNGGAASAVWDSTTYGDNGVSGTVPNNGSDANASAPGTNTVWAKPMTIEKFVSAPNGVIPGQDLDWQIKAEVGSFTDVQSLVLVDQLSDGQHFDASVTPTLVIDNLGATTTIDLTTSEYTVARDASTGITTMTINVSQAMIDNGLAGDLNGGAAPTDATPNAQPADFVFSMDSTIDPLLIATTPAPIYAQVMQGDALSNGAELTGQLVNGGATISDGSGAAVSIPVDTVHKDIAYVTPVGDSVAQANTIDGVSTFSNGFTPTTTANFAAGELVTYHLQLVMPITGAADVQLEDFLPLPVFNVLDPNGATTGTWTFADGVFSNSAPGAGTIEFTANDSFHLQPGIAGQNLDPTITVDATDNALILNFGSVDATNYAGSTLDLLFTVGVTDAAFAQNLLLTNQVTSSETNSFGTVAQSNAIIQFTMDSPELKIEKGVVASSNSAAHFTSTLGPVTFDAAGSAGVRFTGTIDDTNLASTPIGSSLTNADAGDIETFAMVVENYGSSTDGAFDVMLQDVLPTGFVIPTAGLNLEVTNGAGQALAYTDTLVNGTLDITLTDPGQYQGALASNNATSGANIAVITYDLQLENNIPVPNDQLTNTATVTNFAALAGGTNDTGTEAASNLTASATVTTAFPTVVKSLVATDQTFTSGSNLAIGEQGTYDITLTLPEGQTTNLDLSDVLPTGLGLVSASVLSVGADLSGSLIGAAPTISGNALSIDFGNVLDTPTGVSNAGDQIVVQVVGVAEANAGLTAGKTLTNTVDVTETDANTGNTDTQTSSASANVVVPALSLSKTVSSAHVQGGDEVTYTLTLSNAASANSTDAFNAAIDDLMAGFGSNMTFVEGSVAISGNDAADASIVTGDTTGDTTVAVDVSTITPGQNVVVTFEALVDDHATDDAKVTNVATATAQTLPAGDVGAQTNTVSGTATLQILAPVISKTIVATSDANTSGSNVAVGETITYDITVTLPHSNSSDVVISDPLLAGLTYVAGSEQVLAVGADLSTLASGTIGAPTVSTDGNGISLDFGGIYDAPGGSGAADQITVQLQAVVNTNAGNINGATLDNIGTIATNGTSWTSAANATVVVPTLSITKTSAFVGHGAHDAGSEIAYSINVVNQSSLAPAYSVDVSDLLPSGETLSGAGAITVTIGGVAQTGDVTVSGNDITVDVGTLLQSQTMTISYDGTLTNAVTPGETLDNTANLSYVTEVTNGETFTGTSSSPQTVVITPTLAKTIIATSDSSVDAALHGGATNDLAIGDTVTYQMVATLEPGTQSLVFNDALPSGLVFVSGSVASIGADISGGSLALGAVPTSTTGNDVVFNFGTVVDAAGGSGAADQVVVDVTARLTSGANNAVITNTGSVTTAGPAGAGSKTATSAVAVDVVKPDLTLTKTSNYTGGPAGTEVTYTLTIAEASDSTGAAFNVSLADPLAAGLTLVAGSETTSDGATVTESGNGFTVNVGTVDYGASPITVTYEAVLANSVTPGDVLTNTGSLTYDSAVTNGTTVTTTGSVAGTVDITPTLVKTIIATSDGSTDAALHGGAVDDLAIGETVTYQMVATLEPGTQSLVFNDALPSGLVFVSGSVASIGASVSGSALTLGEGPTSTTGNDVVFNLGTVVDAAGGSTASNEVVVDVTARLASGSNNAVVTNTGSVTTAGPAGAGSSTATSSVAVDVVAPDLTVAKSTSFTSGAVGSLVTYTLTIAEASDSSATAYNVSLADPLSAGLALVAGSETTSDGATVTESGNGFVVNIGTMAYGAAPITVTYQAQLAASDVNGGTVPNTATLTYDSEASNGQVLTAHSNNDTVGSTITDSLTKTLVSSSVGPIVNADVAQGETITFDLTATLGSGTQVLQLADALPGDYTYASSSVVSLGTVTGSALAVGQSGTFNAGSDTVSFNFGTVTTSDGPVVANGDQVTVAVSVVVGNGPVGTNVTNTGTLMAAVPANAFGVAAGTAMPTLNASVTDQIVAPGTVSGHVYDDGLNNGIYHVGDAGITGVTVKLYTSSGIYTGLSTVTDDTGAYSFNFVVPGDYEVLFVAPQGMQFSPQDQGSNAQFWSVANVATGFSTAFTVGAASTTSYEDALLNFNGSPTATAADIIGDGQNWNENQNPGVTTVIGGSGDNVHNDSSADLLIQLHGGDNIVETGSGTDIVLMCGGSVAGNNAQALGVADFMFSGANQQENFLQGSSGADYEMASGQSRIAGGAGPSVLVGANAGGTVTLSGGVPIAFTASDTLLPGSGATTILYQRGDGVEMINGFDNTQDQIDIYGYSAPAWVGRIDGYQVMYFGGNDMLVFNGGYMPTTIVGPFPGFDFFASISAEPSVELSFDANGNPSMALTNLTSLPSVAPVAPLALSLTLGIDTNDDGMSDIALQGPDGSVAVWDMNGLAIANGAIVATPGPDWAMVGAGDFFASNHSALVFQNSMTGDVAVWQMNGTSIVSSAVVASPGPTWSLMGTGDFNQSNYTDLLFQNTDGTPAIWLMNGTSVVAAATLPNPGPSWHIVGTGNFNDIGNSPTTSESDIVLQNDNGSVAIWTMDGLNLTGSYFTQDPGPSWHVEGVGDFNGDGNSDLVLQNNDGSIAIWTMTGYNISGGAVVGNPGTDWHVVGTGDYNGDGKSDILMQNNNGTDAVWLMDGTNVIGSTLLTAPGAAWNTLGNTPLRFIDGTASTGTLTATQAPEDFNFTSSVAGAHTIAGFDPQFDLLQLSAASFPSFADVLADTTSVNGGAMIQLSPTSTLFLAGVAPSQLTALHTQLM